MVMYAGRVVEGGDSETVTQSPGAPVHPAARSSPRPTPTGSAGSPSGPGGQRGRRAAEPDRPAAGLPVPPALPVRDGAVQDRAAAPARGRRRARATGPRAGCTTRQRTSRCMSYLLRRIAFYVFTAWAAITINFFIPRLIPGDPVQSLIAKDAGPAVTPTRSTRCTSCSDWTSTQSLSPSTSTTGASSLRGDLGMSFTFFPTPVSEVLGDSLPWTIILVGITTVVSFLLGTGLGVLAGWRRGGWVDLAAAGDDVPLVDPVLLARPDRDRRCWPARQLLPVVGRLRPRRHAGLGRRTSSAARSSTACCPRSPS